MTTTSHLEWNEMESRDLIYKKVTVNNGRDFSIAVEMTRSFGLNDMIKTLRLSERFFCPSGIWC